MMTDLKERATSVLLETGVLDNDDDVVVEPPSSVPKSQDDDGQKDDPAAGEEDIQRTKSLLFEVGVLDPRDTNADDDDEEEAVVTDKSQKDPKSSSVANKEEDDKKKGTKEEVTTTGDVEEALEQPSLTRATRSATSQPGAISVRGTGADSINPRANNNMDDVNDESNLIEAELVTERKEVVEAVVASSGGKKWLYIAIGVLSLSIVIIIVVVLLVTRNHQQATTQQIEQDQPVQNDNITIIEQPDDDRSYTDSLQIGNTIAGSAAGDRFGAPLALSNDGSLVAIGARENGIVGEDSGLARVFQFDNATTGWKQLGNAMWGEAAGDEFAYSGMALSGNGSRLAVGAPFHNAGGLPQAGHVRVFDLDSSKKAWIQVGPSLNGIAAEDLFGRAVAMSQNGSIIAAAAYQSSENGEYCGHVRAFRQAVNETNGETYWEQMGSTLLGNTSLDRLGRSLDMSSDGLRLAAGATQFKGFGPGYVQVFDFNGTEWNQVGEDVWGDNDQDVLGRDIALSSDGSVLAVGANLADDNGEDSGHARVYQLVQTADGVSRWEQMGSTLLGTTEGDGYGLTIDLSSDGSRVAVGASQKKTGVGYVRIFDYDGSEWNQVGDEDLQGATMLDKFGTEVQLSADGETLAVGVIASDANGEDSGHVQVFSLKGL